MLIEALADNAAPTLAGIKTGSLFTVKLSERELRSEIEPLNLILENKGLRLIPLKQLKKGTLVYLYRPCRLKNDLEYPEARSILSELGYPCSDPAGCIEELIRHMHEGGEFPHEIGLFLSYPPEDVRGFINDPCAGTACKGAWRVYGNRNEAEKTFAKYKKCTVAYRKAIRSGATLENLIVV